jgi:hypothetical protein
MVSEFGCAGLFTWDVLLLPPQAASTMTRIARKDSQKVPCFIFPDERELGAMSNLLK